MDAFTMEGRTGISIHNSIKNCMYMHCIQCAVQAEIGNQFIIHFKICTIARSKSGA